MTGEGRRGSKSNLSLQLAQIATSFIESGADVGGPQARCFFQTTIDGNPSIVAKR